MKKKRGTRSGIYGVVAAFMLFTAYDLFKDRNIEETTMTPVVRIFFIAFFAIAGLALIGYAWWNWKKEENEDDSDDDGKGFK